MDTVPDYGQSVFIAGTEAHKRGRRCERSTERPVGVQNSWRYAGPCIAEAAALAPSAA
jgi:hypothetical protein